MGTTISGDTGVVFPDATTQSTAVTVATPFSINASAGAGAQLRLPEATANGVNYVAVKAPDLLAGNVTFTLPTADGTNGQVLQTNGSGTLAFSSVSLSTGVAGTLPIANGGTNSTATPTAGGVPYGTGTAFAFTSAGTSGQVLTSSGSGAPTWATVSSGPVVEFARQIVTQSTVDFTVPTGVTNIRIYACGRGGAGTSSGGGGGGGFGFGTLAVTAGQTINVTINAGVATVARSGTTLITANPGASADAGGAGGTATIHASLSSGGAFIGGAGGSGSYSGGGSAGSPLGNGFAGGSGGFAGGGGIGGVGGNGNSSTGAGGGGAGGAGITPAGSTISGPGGGSGGAASGARGGVGRAILFTDPLLAPLNGAGGSSVGNPSGPNAGINGGPGGGGSGGAGGSGTFSGGHGGFGGGGGSGSGGGAGGDGGALGGGGSGVTGGSSLAGGGGGFSNGSGGPATVWIFY